MCSSMSSGLGTHVSPCREAFPCVSSPDALVDFLKSLTSLYISRLGSKPNNSKTLPCRFENLQQVIEIGYLSDLILLVYLIVLKLSDLLAP
jgi:hypothetical protein